MGAWLGACCVIFDERDRFDLSVRMPDKLVTLPTSCTPRHCPMHCVYTLAIARGPAPAVLNSDQQTATIEHMTSM